MEKTNGNYLNLRALGSWAWDLVGSVRLSPREFRVRALDFGAFICNDIGFLGEQAATSKEFKSACSDIFKHHTRYRGRSKLTRPVWACPFIIRGSRGPDNMPNQGEWLLTFGHPNF